MNAGYRCLPINRDKNQSPEGARTTDEELRISAASERLGDFLGAGFPITADDVDRVGFPRLVLKALEKACKNGVSGQVGCTFQLLSAFQYADSEHTMITVTGIIAPDKDRKTFLSNSGIERWNLRALQWGSPFTIPIKISVPEISMSERLFIDKHLPGRKPETILQRLGHNIGDGSKASLDALECYCRFYRHFPQFTKVVI